MWSCSGSVGVVSACDFSSTLSGCIVETMGISLVAAVCELLECNARGQRTLLGNDVILSVVFEMIRIYTHPFLSGCGEQACCECSCGSEKWSDGVFVDNSAHNNPPTANLNVCGDNPDAPTANLNLPGANPDAPTANLNISGANPDAPAANPHSPTTNTQPPSNQNWNDLFCRCSGKISMLDFLVNCLFGVRLLSVTNI